jgi:hypothetical protein
MVGTKKLGDGSHIMGKQKIEDRLSLLKLTARSAQQNATHQQFWLLLFQFFCLTEK